MEEKQVKKMVAGVAGAASGQMVKQASTATGWVRVAWIIGAAIAGAIGWLFSGGDTTQVQPEVSEPPAAVGE